MAPTTNVARGVLSNFIFVYPFLQESTNITRQLKYYEETKCNTLYKKHNLKCMKIVKFWSSIDTRVLNKNNGRKSNVAWKNKGKCKVTNPICVKNECKKAQTSQLGEFKDSGLCKTNGSACGNSKKIHDYFSVTSHNKNY